MTKVKIRLQCPECSHKFYAPSLFPECCPHCGYQYDPHDDTVISMPAIKSLVSKVADQTYRDLERSSEARAEAAAQMAGVPVSDMSGLKLTDLRDNTKYGEIAAPPVNNAVTQQMEFLKQRGAPVGFGANGAEFAAGTAQGAVNVNGHVVNGIYPRAGSRALHVISPNADANTLGVDQYRK
jgi:hypothetical protein